jgi:hypothetical protein
MLTKSAGYTRRRMGQTFALRTAAFFCVMMPRSTFESVGFLDEKFNQGFFEDDDYCRRIEQIGLQIVCADDVFVHHHLSASFNLLSRAERQKLFNENRKIYESKWGRWQPRSTFRTTRENAPTLRCMAGECNICGNTTVFTYSDVALWRESLNCAHCGSTSRYRSIARGILQAISELTGIEASSLASLPRDSDQHISLYDTQVPFYYEGCSYPIPDVLKKTNWINVTLSKYQARSRLGKRLGRGITNQNLERLKYKDASFDLIITSDVLEHVRLDGQAHKEIYRVLKDEGVYLFTVPHDWSLEKTLQRVGISADGDPSEDVLLLEPEYHGDANGIGGVLSYRTYGRDFLESLRELGLNVEYCRDNFEQQGIMDTELFFCKKNGVNASFGSTCSST